MASVPSDNGHDTPCDKCGAPASWADASTSNLSWKQSLKHHLDTFLLSPRMWPIGFIIQSPYSPLQLEMEMPDRNTWRDAFEDLLALESGGQMISLESRKKEVEVAQRLWHSHACHEISFINEQINIGAKYMSLLKRMQDVAVRKKMNELLEGMGQAIPIHEALLNQHIATGKALVARFERLVSKSQPASVYKIRGQWMASLVSSGALPSWHAQIYDSSEGHQVHLSKPDRNLEDDGTDGQIMTEEELDNHFDAGIPMQVGSPAWSTHAGYYPTPEIIPEFVREGADDEEFRYRSSILTQLITAERTKSGRQDLSTKVVLRTLFTDGATEVKEISDDSCKVLEESQKVYTSMFGRSCALLMAREKARYDLAARVLKLREESDELD